MQKRNTAPARALATIALVGGVIAVIVVISSAGGGGSGASNSPARTRTPAGSSAGPRPLHTPAAYIVKNGDTLTSIAHKTGVSVVRIQALNPKVDPQILISGQRLKLR
jgi:LysM repeat protein